MYFSKNSRYVLRRAQFISSTSYFLNCIKGVKNKYSVKSPKDDPTKPPLRLNIPSESSRGLETYTGVSQGSSRTYQEDFSEPRSKSLLSKPNSLTTNFEDDYYNIQRSGSELQFSNFKEETKRSECDPETFASANQNKCSNLGVDISKSESLVIDSVAHQKNETDVNEGLVTFIEENYSSNTTREHESPENLKNDCKSATQFQEKMETQIPFQGKLDNESKSLYIVINMPESSGELADANVTKVPEQKTAVSCDWKADQSLTKSVSDKNLSTKTDWEGNGNNLISNLKTRGKSFSNLPSKAGEGKSNPKIKFKVYEIDDATAYVFHLRLHNKLRRKACAVGRVLEKEIKARSEDFIDGNSHIQSRIPVVNSKKNYKTWGENVALAENNMDHLKIREMKIQNRFKREKKSAESCKKKNKSTTNFGKLGETWKSKSFQKSNSSASCQSRKRSKHKNHDSMYYMYPGISSKTFSCKSSTANSCCAEVASNKAKPSTKAEVAANSNLEVFDENYYKNIEGPDNANSKLCKVSNLLRKRIKVTA